MRALALAVLCALAVAAGAAAGAGATGECHGIQSCIHVPGPWVVVPAHGAAQFMLACPKAKGGVVGGLDAQVTSREVHVSFDGRLGAPVQPGQTTTRYAFFRAWSSSAKAQLFQPLLGCIPSQGGGGRSTVSARVSPPGPSLEYRATLKTIGPGAVAFAKVSCLAAEHLVGSWSAVAFATKQPPPLVNATRVGVSKHVTGRQVVATASAAETLALGVHAEVQAGAECGP